MVPGAGIEPARSHLRGILSPLRLPVPPSGRLRVQDWRLGPESNRRTRICNPLHHHSATQPLVTISTNHVEISSLADLNTGLKKQMPRTASRPRHRCRSWPALPTNCGIWSGKPGSNRRPQPWQGCALPTELFPHFLGFLFCCQATTEQRIKKAPILVTHLLLSRKVADLADFFTPWRANPARLHAGKSALTTK